MSPRLFTAMPALSEAMLCSGSTIAGRVHKSNLKLQDNEDKKRGLPPLALLLDLISVLVAFFGGGSLRPTLCLYFCNRRKGLDAVS